MATLQSRVQTLTNLYLVAKTRRGILHFLSFYCPAKLYLLQPTEIPAVTDHSEVCSLHAQYHVPIPAPWLGVLYLPATISFPPSVARSLWFLPTNFFHFLLLNSECPWPFLSRLMPHSCLPISPPTSATIVLRPFVQYSQLQIWHVLDQTWG